MVVHGNWFQSSLSESYGERVECGPAEISGKEKAPGSHSCCHSARVCLLVAAQHLAHCQCTSPHLQVHPEKAGQQMESRWHLSRPKKEEKGWKGRCRDSVHTSQCQHGDWVFACSVLQWFAILQVRNWMDVETAREADQVGSSLRRNPFHPSTRSSRKGWCWSPYT